MAKPLPTASLEHERALCAQGFARVAGLDEAGRGAWAGPVVAAAVILPPATTQDHADLLDALAGVNDSKTLTPQRRAALVPVIQEVALAWGVGRAISLEIDDVGIVTATRWAMTRALRKLNLLPDYLLTESLGFAEDTMPSGLAPDRQLNLVRGDQVSLSIAAASILAKVSRDEFMFALDEQYPEYGFARHKGYGTARHKDMLAAHGPCPVHRRSFKPIQALIATS